MRTFFSRVLAGAVLSCLCFALFAPQPTYALEPLLRKPTGSCPDAPAEVAGGPNVNATAAAVAGAATAVAGALVGADMPAPAAAPAAAPLAGPQPRACVNGICVGTNIPCNYKLEDIRDNVIGIGNWIFGIIGVVVLVMFMYGGAVWLMSAGNSSAVEHGRAVMTGSLIGLLLIFSAGTIVKVFLKAVGARDDIYNSLPIQGNMGTQAAGAAAAAVTKKPTCSCSIKDISSDDALQYSSEFVPPAGVLANQANCKTNYKKTLEIIRDAELKKLQDFPDLAAQYEAAGMGASMVAAKYDTYIAKSSCTVVNK